MKLYVGVNLPFYYFIWILRNMWIFRSIRKLCSKSYTELHLGTYTPGNFLFLSVSVCLLFLSLFLFQKLYAKFTKK